MRPARAHFSHTCEKVLNFCPADEYFSQLVSPALSFPTAKFETSLWRPSSSILSTPFRTSNFKPHWGGALSSYVPSAVACVPAAKISLAGSGGGRDRAQPKKGNARLQQKYTAGGQKFGLLAVTGDSANPIPLESYQVCFSHGISRSGFPSCF